MLNATQAQRHANGICYVAIQYTARNSGRTSTGPFTSTWAGGAVAGPSRTWPGLAAGGNSAQTDSVALRPGQTLLQLRLDSTNSTVESNELNNDFRLTIQLTGDCGAVRAAPITSPPPASRRLHLPSR